MDITKLLHLLSDGEFHSGSELGMALGVSRTSVWKSLPLLEKLSILTETVKGKGYRVPGGLDLLDRQKILESVISFVPSSDFDIDVLLSHESTNNYLIDLVKKKELSKYHVCLAERQLGGRGRRGRVWVSPFAKNIYLSLGFSLEVGVDQLSGLSLVIGIAVAQTLEAFGVKDIGLKWPNDVYIEGRKIAGILVELSGEATTVWNVVCGIGLNVSMTRKEGESIDQDWASLEDYVQCGRNEVAAELIKQLIDVVNEFRIAPFEHFMSRWARYDVLLGEDVRVMPGEMYGKVVGVNKLGALLIDNGEVNEVNAGEVSVRRM